MNDAQSLLQHKKGENIERSYQKKLDKSKEVSKCIAVRKVATPLRELTCHTESHSVTCHPADVTFPPLP